MMRAVEKNSEAPVVLAVNNLSKQYRLGTIGTGTISHDLNRWWAKIRGKQDPYLKIGETNDRAVKGNSDYVWALEDVNFEVRKGEVLGIIGKNGAGKSTLLKILSKVTGPTTGSINYNGRIASLLEVGTGFHPEMTGKENIFLNGAILGMTKKEIAEKLEEIVAFSGCERYIDTPVKRYSSGMRVRLAFAVAAFLEPDILIVDEVLAVGDAEFQKKAIGKMQDIASGEGRTVLFVSHDMAAIQNLCKKGLLLVNGTVKAYGNIDMIVKQYLLVDDKNQTENLCYDLTKSEKFSDTSFFELTKMEVLDEVYGKGFQVGAGHDCEFKIYFILREEIIGNPIKIGITIKDDHHNPITTFNSTFVGEKLYSKGKTGLVSCCVNSFNLVPGEYGIHIWFVVDNDKQVIFENAGKITVVENDVYKTGVIPDSFYHGHVFHKDFTFQTK